MVDANDDPTTEAYKRIEQLVEAQVLLQIPVHGEHLTNLLL